LKVAEIFNITRVLFLPIIVLWLAAWYVKHEEGAEKVNLGQVVISKFPVFVLGFIAMFALSSIGTFAPAGHYKGKYFSSEQVKEDKLLKSKEVRALESELTRLKEAQGSQELSKYLVEGNVTLGKRNVTTQDVYQALGDLISNRKIMTREEDSILESMGKMPGFDELAKGSIHNAHKAAFHTAKTIKSYRNWIAWLFAFGLIGLGMQITGKALKQAGGKPLVIGGVVGTGKAIGSLIVVMLFVKEFI